MSRFMFVSCRKSVCQSTSRDTRKDTANIPVYKGELWSISEINMWRSNTQWPKWRGEIAVNRSNYQQGYSLKRYLEVFEYTSSIDESTLPCTVKEVVGWRNTTMDRYLNPIILQINSLNSEVFTNMWRPHGD